eukprot:m.342041 g.342041  ORF g.342041 m.342041 type:complete len:1071 (+) comp20838_c0_seq1:321-3533(+)
MPMLENKTGRLATDSDSCEECYVAGEWFISSTRSLEDDFPRGKKKKYRHHSYEFGDNDFLKEEKESKMKQKNKKKESKKVILLERKDNKSVNKKTDKKKKEVNVNYKHIIDQGDGTYRAFGEAEGYEIDAGTFDTAEEAARAMDDELVELKVNPQRLNFPQERKKYIKNWVPVRAYDGCKLRNIISQKDKHIGRIQWNDTVIEVGTFKTKLAAVEAVDKKLVQLKADPFKLNYPENHVQYVRRWANASMRKARTSDSKQKTRSQAASSEKDKTKQDRRRQQAFEDKSIIECSDISEYLMTGKIHKKYKYVRESFGKWRTFYSKNDVYYFLGVFNTAVEAARCVDAKIVEMKDDPSKLSFPQDHEFYVSDWNEKLEVKAAEMAAEAEIAKLEEAKVREAREKEMEAQKAKSQEENAQDNKAEEEKAEEESVEEKRAEEEKVEEKKIEEERVEEGGKDEQAAEGEKEKEEAAEGNVEVEQAREDQAPRQESKASKTKTKERPFPNVQYLKKQNKFRACFKWQFQKIDLGLYDTAVEAALALDERMVEVGVPPFRLNFPGDHQEYIKQWKQIHKKTKKKGAKNKVSPSKSDTQGNIHAKGPNGVDAYNFPHIYSEWKSAQPDPRSHVAMGQTLVGCPRHKQEKWMNIARKYRNTRMCFVDNTWGAFLYVHGHPQILGSFKTEIEAARHVDKILVEQGNVHPDVLNFPNEHPSYLQRWQRSPGMPERGKLYNTLTQEQMRYANHPQNADFGSKTQIEQEKRFAIMAEKDRQRDNLQFRSRTNTIKPTIMSTEVANVEAAIALKYPPDTTTALSHSGVQQYSDLSAKRKRTLSNDPKNVKKRLQRAEKKQRDKEERQKMERLAWENPLIGEPVKVPKTEYVNKQPDNTTPLQMTGQAQITLDTQMRMALNFQPQCFVYPPPPSGSVVNSATSSPAKHATASMHTSPSSYSKPVEMKPSPDKPVISAAEKLLMQEPSKPSNSWWSALNKIEKLLAEPADWALESIAQVIDQLYRSTWEAPPHMITQLSQHKLTLENNKLLFREVLQLCTQTANLHLRDSATALCSRWYPTAEVGSE